MKALLKAVKTKLDGSAALAVHASGGICAGRAAEGAVLPYLVWARRPARRPQYTTGGAAVERVVVRFEVFSNAAAGAAAAAEEVERLFAEEPPVLEVGALIQARKVRDGLSLEGGTTGEGEEVWRAGVELEFMVERSAAS